MPNYPQILYWKWDEGIFVPGVLEQKLQDILNRSGFSHLYVSFHWMDRPFGDRELIATIEKCCRMLHEAGWKFILDIDVRNEGKEFFARYPGESSFFIEFVELTLDQDGHGRVTLEPMTTERWIQKRMTLPDRVVGSWSFLPAAEGYFQPDSLLNLLPQTRLEPTPEGKMEIVVAAGRENSGKRVLVVPATPHVMPDLFSPALYRFYKEMFAQVKHLPLDGIGVDEWGHSPAIYVDGQGVYLKHLAYSPHMAAEYEGKYGRKLKDELLYLRYAPDGEDGIRLRAINGYIENLRQKMVENEAWIYDQAKATFGPDTFVSAHPTWWGAPTDFHLEVLYNGLDWWEVKRDYAQTDEAVLLPTRLALARKCGGKVWYNMFYSAGTGKAETYFRETWQNARYGGRTHYLGYECPNESGVLEFQPAGVLETMWSMDERMKALNDFQETQPDSRVLVVFGMEAVTNWAFRGEVMKEWRDFHPVMRQAMEFTRELFCAGYLCDLAPSSEIVNGNLQLDRGKPVYSGHDYDALVFVYPECVPGEVFREIRTYLRETGKMIMIGDCRYFHDGRDARAEFKALKSGVTHYFPALPPVDEVIAILERWRIPRNTLENGCVFEDGSVVFTAEGEKNIGNALKVDVIINGHQVRFEGEDFLALRLSLAGKMEKWAAGRVKSFIVDGILISVDL